MVLITGTVAASAGAATTVITAEKKPIFYLGRSYIPGTELLTAGTFLEWFAETPTGGGSFGSAPPNQARVRARAVVTGSLRQRAYLGVGDPTPNANRCVGTSTLTGSLRVAARIQNNTLQSLGQVSGLTALTIFLTGEINAVSVVTGNTTSIVFPELDPEVLVGVFGRRPCFPLLVYLEDVTHIGNLLVNGSYVVGMYQAFLVSPNFLPIGGDFMTDRGALPNSLGMRVMTDVQGDGIEEEAVLFRRPRENEVVAVRAGTKVLRWSEEEQAWLSYRTVPQRALDGMRLFELFDPNGIWDYVAKIIGLKFWQLSRDTERMLDFIDPLLCPDQYVAVLARNFGCPVDADAPIAEQRESIRNWIPLMKLKGTPQAVTVALRSLGFSGYATQIWVRPGGSATEFQERPFNFDGSLPSGLDSEFYPASQVAIHLNNPDGSPLLVIDDGTKQRIARFLVENVLPAHVRIRTFTTDVNVGEEEVAIDDGNAIAVYRNKRIGLLAVQARPATVAISVSILPNRGTVVAQAGRATCAISGVVISS